MAFAIAGLNTTLARYEPATFCVVSVFVLSGDGFYNGLWECIFNIIGYTLPNNQSESENGRMRRLIPHTSRLHRNHFRVFNALLELCNVYMAVAVLSMPFSKGSPKSPPCMVHTVPWDKEYRCNNDMLCRTPNVFQLKLIIYADARPGVRFHSESINSAYPAYPTMRMLARKQTLQLHVGRNAKAKALAQNADYIRSKFMLFRLQHCNITAAALGRTGPSPTHIQTHTHAPCVCTCRSCVQAGRLLLTYLIAFIFRNLCISVHNPCALPRFSQPSTW